MRNLTLAPVIWSDGDELIEAHRANRDYHRPWVSPFTDRVGFEAWFGQRLSGPHVGLVAREIVSGGVVGVFNLSQIVGGVFRSAYLGYYGSAAFGGRGLMTEGLRLAARYAFDELGLHRLEANIQPENTRSIALARRVGFRLEGFSPQYLFIDGAWRDHERWALLAGEI